jgi:transcriptional regulator with XRE-family HTH domain
MADTTTDTWSIGATIRRKRQEREMSLAQLAEVAQVSKSNLSKIENNVISPTFDMIEKIAAGLESTAATLLSRPASPGEMLSFTDRGEGVRSGQGNYEFEFLFADLDQRRMMPMITTVRPRDSEVLSPPSFHGGEEFFTVLEGTIDFHSGTDAVRPMSAGDSVYFSSDVKHLVVNTGQTEARLLWVWIA